MKKISTYLILIILLCSCSTANVVDRSKLDTIINHKLFEIESNIAQPITTVAMSQLQSSGLLGPGNSSGNISLIGNSNFLKIRNDSISSYLPYFGERRLNVAYGNSNNAIELEGLMTDYKAVWNDKKKYYMLTFQSKSNNETFDISIQLYPNLKSYITLNSASRTSITYIGSVKTLKEEDDNPIN